MPMMAEWLDPDLYRSADRALPIPCTEAVLMPINETQVKINDILARGCYLLVGVDPAGKEGLKVHFVNVPAPAAMKIILGLSVQAAQRDDTIKRDFLAAATSLAQELVDEEVVKGAILRPH